MLGIDVAVWLALLLSVGSALLCVVYGLARWDADDDAGSPPPLEADRAVGGEGPTRPGGEG